MTNIQHSFVNDKDSPIYVSVEPRPECFELEPGDRLTLVWSGPDDGDVAQLNFINEHELVVWPNGETDSIQYLINGEDAAQRSWKFKHR